MYWVKRMGALKRRKSVHRPFKDDTFTPDEHEGGEYIVHALRLRYGKDRRNNFYQVPLIKTDDNGHVVGTHKNLACYTAVAVADGLDRNVVEDEINTGTHKRAGYRALTRLVLLEQYGYPHASHREVSGPPKRIVQTDLVQKKNDYIQKANAVTWLKDGEVRERNRENPHLKAMLTKTEYLALVDKYFQPEYAGAKPSQMKILNGAQSREMQRDKYQEAFKAKLADPERYYRGRKPAGYGKTHDSSSSRTTSSIAGPSSGFTGSSSTPLPTHEEERGASPSRRLARMPDANRSISRGRSRTRDGSVDPMRIDTESSGTPVQGLLRYGYPSASA
ncbi:hypothetical protein HDU93_000649 [Gonapodya sp. JEL0774]|nr:hypothetical protein HDU93_000649 [Gonapodya sp. JEL0774]